MDQNHSSTSRWSRGDTTRRLRFLAPQNLCLDPGFLEQTRGKVILEVRGRRLDRLKVEVADWATPRGLVKLGNTVLAGEGVLEKTFELLATPQRLANGSDSGAGYGMGLRSRTVRLSENGPSVRVVHNGGTATGAMSFLVLLPEHDIVVSLQGNLLFEAFTGPAAVAYALAEVALPGAESATPGSTAR